MRAVLDANVILSALIRPTGPNGEILRRLDAGDFQMVYSPAWIEEITDILTRRRLAERYQIGPADVARIVDLVDRQGILVQPSRLIEVCRDPDDNFLLAAAGQGAADVVVSGDKDLLALGQFEGVAILTPTQFIARLDSDRDESP